MGNTCIRSVGINSGLDVRSRDIVTEDRTNGIDLTKLTWKDTKPFVAPVEEAYVIKVYDGDTITVASKLNNSSLIYRFSIRLAGIDTPEIKTDNKIEHERALFVRDRLSDLILNKIIQM